MEVVNIAAVGDLNHEIDIEVLVEDAPLPVANYDPKLNASFFRFEEDGELVILYTSGKYILRGGDDFQKMHKVNDRFLEMLGDLGIEVDTANLVVKNVVAVEDLNREIDLNALMIDLGMEKVEYEPEQFPGLVYRPDGTNCVLLVFGSGKVVIAGGRTAEENKEAFELLSKRVEKDSVH